METRRDIFQAIADPTRRAILSLIALQAMTPNAIAEHFDSSRQAVSKHIKILAECQLVKQKQSGREIYYHFNPQKMRCWFFVGIIRRELLQLSENSNCRALLLRADNLLYIV